MSHDDWFRRTTWGPAERNAFHTRLQRSRGPSRKAQYLRIQAAHLQEAALFGPAIELLDDLIESYPVAFELASAHLQRAQCLDALERPLEAIEAFRASVDAQRAFPDLVTRVAYELAMFCVRRRLDGLFEEAESVLNELTRQPQLPVERFEESAFRAVVAAQRADAAAARTHAQAALAAAAAEGSGFRYHPQIGLVGAKHADLIARLARLCTVQP
jgi:tetratricopeptide (TPR) repeat protein